MKKRVVVCFMALMLGLSGCGSGDKNASYDIQEAENHFSDYGFSDYYGMEEEYSDFAAEDAGVPMAEVSMSGSDHSSSKASSGESSQSVAANQKSNQKKSEEYGQKLIKTYQYEIETLEFDQAFDWVEKKVVEFGGYIEDATVSGSSRRNSDLQIRIPVANSNEFLEQLGSLGETIYKSMNAEDVTLDYYDTSARLESLKAQRERLLELMKSAADLDDVVALQSQLSDVEYEINRYTSRIRVYDNKVDYVTIQLRLNEVKEITVIEEDTIGTRIQKGFVRSYRGVVEFLGDLLVFLVSNIPTFILWGIILTVVILVIKRIRRKRADRPDKPNKKNKEDDGTNKPIDTI